MPSSPIPNTQLTESARKVPLYIPDDSRIDLNHFLIPAHYADTLDYMLISHGMIVDRVEKLAFDITQDYKNETLHLLCVLKGGSSFFADLCSAIRKFHDYTRSAHIPFTYDFVKVKSYEGTSSTGSVEITGCDVNKLANKHVILVEDIIDTGLTMCKLLEHLNTNVALSSLRVASLVEKRTSRSNGFKGDYVGFSIPDHFVVGYGLDYNQVYRDMLHIAVINEKGIARFAASEDS